MADICSYNRSFIFKNNIKLWRPSWPNHMEDNFDRANSVLKLIYGFDELFACLDLMLQTRPMNEEGLTSNQRQMIKGRT